MAGMYTMTTNHEEIKKWAVENGARPAIIDQQQARGDTVGIRLNFPGKEDEELLSVSQTRDISWDEFFRIFEEEDLTFLYTEDKQTSNPTDWYSFDNRYKDFE